MGEYSPRGAGGRPAEASWLESFAEGSIFSAPRQEATAEDLLMALLPSSPGFPGSRQKLQTSASSSDVGHPGRLLRGISHN